MSARDWLETSNHTELHDAKRIMRDASSEELRSANDYVKSIF